MIELVFMAVAAGGTLYFLKLALGTSTSMDWLFSLLPKGIEKLFGGEKFSGAKFMPSGEERQFLNSRNEGLILDGVGRKRLSLKNSFEHVAIISPTGGGKTTKFIIPNLLELDDCSIVVTDPSGELYEKTSGHMAERGFEVKVLNLADPSHGLCYNPIAKANTYTEIDKLARILMRSSAQETKAEDEIWYDEAEALISILIRCLKTTGEPEWQNLHNLLFLLQSFGADGKPLQAFVEQYAPKDDNNMTRNQFVAFVNGHEKMMSSFLTMARSALKLLNNPEIASMMSRDEFDFDELRRRKTVIYLISPEADAEFYGFILNLFYTQLFESQKQERYMTEGLCLHVLYDEFGNSRVPNFGAVATTIRKYRVSLSIILQDYGQLEKQYGKEDAKTILSGGIRTKLFYAGLDVDTSVMVEQMLGKVVVEQKGHGTKQRREDNLMNADRIRRMAANEALCVSSNKEPILLNTTASFQNPRLKSALRKPPFPLPKPLPVRNLKFITLP